MEKGKEAFGKPCPDVYSGKNLSVSKTSFIKNNAHLPIRPETGKKKLPYIPRAKNVSMPVDKKYGFYKGDTNSFMNHSCDKCVIKGRPHFVVNTTAATSLTELPKFEPAHDFNGNVSFSTRSTSCNFTASVSEISSFNQVLSFQPNPHYEISFPKPLTHKRGTYIEYTTYSPKVANSPNSFNANRFFSSIPNSTIRYHCSKGFPQKFANSEPYFKFPDRTSRENIAVTDKYSKYVKYATLPDTCLSKDTSVKLNDLPIFETSRFPKDSSMACKVDFSDDQLKQRNYSSKKWNPVPITQNFGESSKSLNQTDKILFPALPSSHSQQVKLNSSSTNMISSEHLSVENSDLENIQSSDGSNSSLIVSTGVSSAIPQASYADVIRMSVMPNETQGFVALDYEKTDITEPNQTPKSVANFVEEKQSKDDNPQTGGSDWVISRLSQIDLNIPETANGIALTSTNQNGQNFTTPRPIVVSLEKPSFYNSSLQTCKNVLSALSSNTNILPDKKIVESDNIVVDYLSNMDKISIDNNSSLGSTNRSSVSSDFTASITDTQAASIKTDSVYSSPSSVSSLGDAFKPIESKDLVMDNLFKKIIPPVIIMNNYSPESMAEISFGIEYDEMLKLCSDTDSCNVEDNIPLVAENIENSSPENNKINSLCLGSSKLPESTPKSEIEASQYSIISVKGRNLYWKDSESDCNGSNHVQLVEYIAGAWEDVQKDCVKGSSCVNGSVRYFNEL